MDRQAVSLQAENIILTESDGTYQGRLWVKKDLVAADTLLEMTVYKPGYEKKTSLIPVSDRFTDGATFIVNADLQIERKIGRDSGLPQ